MKKLLILMFCVLAAPLSYAESISEQEAYKIAQQFMQDKFETAMPNAQKQRKALKSKRVAAAQKNLYIFNAEAGGGFVIVSGDDRTLAILGYSDRGEIDTENLPCNVKWLLDSYDSAIASLDGNSEATAAAKENSSITAIEPLIDTQWGQGSPYNDLCPQVAGGEHCVTGCVATAMAQIINYNRWPQGATSSVAAYTSESNSISMPELPAYTFDWNNMGDNAKARLMLYCGQSVSMDYGTGGSGAYVSNVVSALQDVFGYSKSTSYKSRSSDSSEEWDDMLYEELSAGRPVLFGGQSSTGGHAFVVDGYDSDGKYHINWGWEGYCDGYFTLDDLDPTGSGGFNSNQEIVYNIALPADASDITRPKAVVTQMAASSSSLERTSASVDFASLTISSTLQSDMSETATIQVGLALYNDDGLVKVLSSGSHEFTTAESYTYEASVTIGSSIPQGEYRIVAINRSSDSDEWLADAGSSEVYISVTVNETGLLLNVLPSGSEDEYYIDFGTHTIDGITYHLYSEYENNRATVMPLSDNEKYSGNIYVPDSVNYQNIRFVVYNTNSKAFNGCSALTSLSIRTVDNYGPCIANCESLANLELREGTLNLGDIDNNPSLQSITIPSTCSSLCAPTNCSNLKSLTFKNKKKFTIYYSNSLVNKSNSSLTDIYFASDIPPKIGANSTITAPSETVNIHIPSGTIEAYKNSDWRNCSFIEDQPAMPINVHWDYCGNDEDASCGFAIGEGDNNVEIAMRIPANCMTAYKGCEISAVEFYTTPPPTNDWHMADIEYVFVTTDGTDYLAKKSVKTIRGTWMTVEFDQPYVITGEALYVGLGRYHSIEASWANLDVVDDGFWLRVMATDPVGTTPGSWEKHAGFSSGWNYTLPIRAIIKGDKLPIDIAIGNVELIDGSEQQSDAKSLAKANVLANTSTISNLNENGGYFSYMTDDKGNYYTTEQPQCATQQVYKATANDNKQLKVKLRNRTPRTVKQVTLDWDIDGKHQGQQTIETVMLLNHEDNVYLDIPSNISGRNHTMAVNVSSIDGEADEIPANSTDSVKFSTEASSFFPRKVVMEEVTGTWCGYCPRGIVGVEKMNEQYPDNFIAIAVHDDNDMWPQNYDALFAMVSSVPTAYINRLEWIDPSPFDLTSLKDGGEATIKATASFVSGGIQVNTETMFGFSDDGSTEYRIAYVLLEDSVGPYYQTNYYSDPTSENSDDMMDWWIHQDYYVETVYNDVARAIYDYEGIEGLLPLEITEGETYMSEYTLTLPDNIQDARNLKVVALLLDTSMGEVLNADRTSISGDITIDIDTVSGDDSATFDVYNLMGVKVGVGASSLKGLPQGVYIVNGKKVLVK